MFHPAPQGGAEGDGWIVRVCNRLDEQRSELLLFDALEIAKGPIATIQIPIRMRFGLHGNWAEAADIGLAGVTGHRSARTGLRVTRRA